MNKLLLSLFLFGCFYTTHASSVEAIENPPIDLFVCDDNDDGFAIFDLTQNDVIVLGTQNSADFTITYHQTLMDAESSVFPIGDPTSYFSASSTVFVRVEANSNGSFEVEGFDLLVFPIPDVPSQVDDLFDCDDNQDGFTSFDLTSRETQVLMNIPTINTGDFIVSYYTTQVDASNGTNPIATPNNYTNQTANTTETIWIRVQTNDGTINNCIALSNFDIIVVTPPIINPTGIDLNITVCNDDSTSDDPIGTRPFDLTVNTDILTGGDDSLNVSYYASIADLASGTPITTLEAYTNISNPQTIHVLVESTEGCFSQTLFDIQVLPLPSPGQPSDIIACDTNDDGDPTNGLVEFNLSETVTIIEAGENVIVTIFDDLALAEATPFDIANVVTTTGSAGEILYTNTIPGGQILYARVDSTISIIDGVACFVVVEINLVVEDCIDMDDDGVSDQDEDLNGNGNLNDDDTDDDGIPNYLDDDDDGDLVMTIDEITGIGAGFAPQDFIDTDDDMIENYLDDDDDGDNVLTIDEDYNNSGSPLDDDINMNDIPDFLDPEVALSTDEFMVANFTIYPNPAIDNITITGSNPFEKISIYDITGKLVLEQATEAQITRTVFIPSIKTGVYFIRIDNQSSAIRFIKQ